MFFDKKIKRSMEVMDERNRLYLEKMNSDKEDAAVASSEPEDNTTEENAIEENAIEENTDEKALTREHEKEYRANNQELGFEKGDLPALIISALLVFSPVFLVLIAIMMLAWFFLS